MEIKKSIQVDLEGKRTTGFLLGLILALSLIFVGLQYTTSPDDSGADEDALEDMAQDMEILHQEEQKDMISVEPTAGAASKAITEKMKAVNQQPQSTEKISQTQAYLWMLTPREMEKSKKARWLLRILRPHYHNLSPLMTILIISEL